MTMTFTDLVDPVIDLTDDELTLGFTLESHFPICIPHDEQRGHTLIAAETGCGKTIFSMLPMMNQDLKRVRSPFIYFDVNEDRAERVHALALSHHRQPIRLSLFSKPLLHFNPLEGSLVLVKTVLNSAFNSFYPAQPGISMEGATEALNHALTLLKHLSPEQVTIEQLYLFLKGENEETQQLLTTFMETPCSLSESEKLELFHYLNIYYQTDACGALSENTYYQQARFAREFLETLLEDPQVKTILTLPASSEAPSFSFESVLEQAKCLIICTEQVRPLSKSAKILTHLLMLRCQLASLTYSQSSPSHSALIYIENVPLFSGLDPFDLLATMQYRGVCYQVSCSPAHYFNLSLPTPLLSSLIASSFTNYVAYQGLSKKSQDLLSPLFKQLDWSQRPANPFATGAYTIRKPGDFQTGFLSFKRLNPELESLLNARVEAARKARQP